MNQQNKIDWFEPSTDWLDFLKTIQEDKEMHYANWYQGTFETDRGTFVDRLRHALAYENTGSGKVVRVEAPDLRRLLDEYEVLNAQMRDQKMDADLRNDPEIINIKDPIEKERRIKEKINFKELMK